MCAHHTRFVYHFCRSSISAPFSFRFYVNDILILSKTCLTLLVNDGSVENVVSLDVDYVELDCLHQPCQLSFDLNVKTTGSILDDEIIM